MSLRESVACCRKASFEGNGRSPWQERQRSGGARQARPSGPSGNRAACVTFLDRPTHAFKNAPCQHDCLKARDISELFRGSLEGDSVIVTLNPRRHAA